MERHLQSSRKLAVFVRVVALSLFLGACGGGGGGGGDSGAVQITARPIPATQRTTTTDTNTSTQSAKNQVTAPTELDTQRTRTADTSASAQLAQNQITAPTQPDTQRTTPSQTSASAPEVGFVSLRWQAPSQRVDGESLSMSEIAGYRIFYGTRSGDYDSILSIDDPYTSTIQIDDLPVGTYYFVMTTVDTSGIESAYSREAVEIVQS